MAVAEAAAHNAMASQLQQAAQDQSPAAINAVSTAEADLKGLLPVHLVQSTKSFASQTLAPRQAVLPTLLAIIAADREHPHAKWMRLQMFQHEAAPHAGVLCAAADFMPALANPDAAPRTTTVFQSGQLRAAARSLTSCASI